MSVWSVATDVAIWTLILGSLAVFAWFLLEIRRLARARRSPASHRAAREDQDQRSSTRSSSIDDR